MIKRTKDIIYAWIGVLIFSFQTILIIYLSIYIAVNLAQFLSGILLGFALIIVNRMLAFRISDLIKAYKKPKQEPTHDFVSFSDSKHNLENSIKKWIKRKRGDD